ncbi:MAG: ABC transporter ATP-binding protein [Nitrososphaerota archaeon]
MSAVEIRGLSKRFGERLALDSISLEVQRGESVLLMGPNGAGKTTLLRCVVGMLSFEGEVRVMGLDVKREGREVRRIIGYVPQQVRFPEDVTVYELVDFVSDVKGVDVDLEEVLGPFGLIDAAHNKVGSLSGGMRQRLAIALSLIGDPQLVLMDEPFSNLDAMSRNSVQEMMRGLMRRGKTLLVSVHTVSGLIHAFDKVAVLRDGRLVGLFRSEDVLRALRPVYRVHIRDGSGWTTYRTEDLFGTLSSLQSSGHDLREVWVEEPDVEELLRAMGG